MPNENIDAEKIDAGKLDARKLEIKQVEISKEPVELYKILKFEGMVPSGGEAKLVIAEGLVKLNGKTETQKRKKIVAGDQIEFNGEKISICLASA